VGQGDKREHESIEQDDDRQDEEKPLFVPVVFEALNLVLHFGESLIFGTSFVVPKRRSALTQ
jgi:hypothetical protein